MVCSGWGQKFITVWQVSDFNLCIRENKGAGRGTKVINWSAQSWFSDVTMCLRVFPDVSKVYSTFIFRVEEAIKKPKVSILEA